MRFAVFTHVEHVLKDGYFFAYSPYIREMNLWLQQIDEVEVVAPLREDTSSNDEPYRHDNLTFTSIPAFDLLSIRSALGAVLKIPVIFARTLAAMNRADHLHLRCPGNIGLIACICQVFFPKKFKTAKYAGNWDPEAKQPWTYKLQKWILSNSFLTRNMQVLVYGEWDRRSKNVVPFFTASFSEKEIPFIEAKDFSGPLTLLFVGNLVAGKQPLEAIKLVEKINVSVGSATKRAPYVQLEIYGDGPEREPLESSCEENRLSEQVIFRGSWPLQELKNAYQKAHFVILPSRSEGWPKALAEGMFYGCIPIATPVSCVPWMLGYGSRGVLLEDLSQRREKSGQRTEGRGQWTRDVEEILEVIKSPANMTRMSEEAKKWSQQYTLERFEEGIRKVLNGSFQKKPVETGKLSPAPFRASPDASGEGVKRGESS